MQVGRASGILLHPTSLPGPFGIGELGEEAYHFAEFLAGSNQRLWQVLPLGPTGYGDSPYASFSSFAGNPMLISLGQLAREGLLEEGELGNRPAFPDNKVDFGPVIEWKMPLLWKSFERFQPDENKDYAQFCKKNSAWLEDFALFMALKDHYHGRAWTEWEPAIRSRQPEALASWREQLASQVHFHRYLQYQFFKQWTALKSHANSKGITIMGDIPIFVAHDSADVWSHPELFYLDEAGAPTVVSGVPPDYFSATGQRWGNPLYRWDVLAETGYAWWIERFRAALAQVDMLRLDHFRGFVGYWEIPAEEETAVKGEWKPGPGAALFKALKKALGNVPIIAEDLGVITQEVDDLRNKFGFPGMRILQFGFSSDAGNFHLPHNFERKALVYTGTHDNDTTVGWYTTRRAEEQHVVRQYLATDGRSIHADFIRAALGSVADLAIVPLQDVLGLGSEARMNLPGRASGNWAWRFRASDLNDGHRAWLAELSKLYGRALPPKKASESGVRLDGM
ncbi:MAG TPA: 4-alpha-glucanotransferase [Ktedonobacterales bacterium]|jgi:4-alpha-glucanotransferase